jgi:hypothetical protein
MRQEEKNNSERKDGQGNKGLGANLVRILDVQAHVMNIMDGVLTRVSFFRNPIFALVLFDVTELMH